LDFLGFSKKPSFYNQFRQPCARCEWM